MARFRGRGGRFTSSPFKSLHPQSYSSVIDGLTPGIAIYAAELSSAVNAVMYQVSQEMEAWAKANAPWNDRTTDAREGLTAAMDESPTHPQIYLYHTVSYGLWLEVRWNGRYAIIMPTIEHFGPILMSEIRAVI